MKKYLITLIAMFAIITTSNAQDWSTYGNTVSSGMFLGTKNNQPLIFKTNGGISSTPQMVITGGTLPNKGFVGINTMNPLQRLHVNQGGILVQNATSNKQGNYTGPFLMFSDNNNTTMSLQLENKGLIQAGLNFKLLSSSYGTLDNLLFITAYPNTNGNLQTTIGIDTDRPMEKINVKDGNVMISGYGNNNTSYYGFNKSEGDSDFAGMIYHNNSSFPNGQSGLALLGSYNNYYQGIPIFISNNDNTKNNVGINNDAPLQKLHVASGNILITKNTLQQHAPGNENGSILFGDVIDLQYKYGHWGIGYTDFHDGKTQGLNFWKPWDQNGGPINAVIFLSSAKQYEGNVGIGTAQPTHKLSVNGTVLAKEVIVSLEECYWPTTREEFWPDYVFSSNYKLMNLSQLEAFIKANKHLPNVPSAAEIENDGIHLGEMNAILLEKIEQMTLYIIDLQKQIDELKQQQTKQE